MLGLLAPLAIKAAKFIGIHALPHIPIINRIPGVSALASLSGGGISNSSGALNILGNRMIIGFCLGGALFNHKFRRGMTLCIEAVSLIQPTRWVHHWLAPELISSRTQYSGKCFCDAF